MQNIWNQISNLHKTKPLGFTYQNSINLWQVKVINTNSCGRLVIKIVIFVAEKGWGKTSMIEMAKLNSKSKNNSSHMALVTPDCYQYILNADGSWAIRLDRD